MGKGRSSKKVDKRKYRAYIDEFGNTGDAVPYNEQKPYGDQPYFCLSAVVIKQGDIRFKKIIESFPANCRESGEVKSTLALQNGLSIVITVFEEIKRLRFKPRIELVDKRYIICSLIVNQFIAPPGEFRNLDAWKVSARYLSETIYENAGEELYVKYSELAHNISKKKVEDFFLFLKCEAHGWPSNEAVCFLLEGLEESKDSFDEGIGTYQYPENIFVEDEAKYGRKVFLAPNISCFSNIYLRLCPLSADITIVHDNQEEFESIIEKQGISIVKLKEFIPELNGVGYENKDIREIPVIFSDSKSDQNIQVADLVCGSIGRLHKKMVCLGSNSLSQEEKRLVQLINDSCIVNYVCPSKHIEVWG